MKSRKGYVLIITIIITLFLTLITLTCFTICYRYQHTVKNRIDDLQEKVNPALRKEVVEYDFNIFNI